MLEILDTAGTEQFTAMRGLYMRTGHGYVVIYSIISEASFLEVTNFREEILRQNVDNVDTQIIPMVLVGNKTDLESDREIPREKGEELAKNFNCRFIETSAKTGDNVEMIFFDLVKEMNLHYPKQKSKKNKCVII